MNKNMEYNFNKIMERIRSAHLETDGYERLKEYLDNIKGNTLITGTGGSYAVARFAKSALKNKNRGHVTSIKPRDIMFEDLDYIDNIIGISYSGKSPSIKNALSNDVENRAVVTFDEEKARSKMKGAEVLSYGRGKKEKSFISLASSLVPMSMFYRYSLGLSAIELVEVSEEIIRKAREYAREENFGNLYSKNNIMEVFTDAKSYTASDILESNIIESGMMPVIRHEKNDFSHGRSILNYNYRNSKGLYLVNEMTKQDELLTFNFLPKFYEDLTIVESENKGITGEFELAIKSMFITKEMANNAGIDLSAVKYPEDIREIYSFDELEEA